METTCIYSSLGDVFFFGGCSSDGALGCYSPSPRHNEHMNVCLVDGALATLFGLSGRSDTHRRPARGFIEVLCVVLMSHSTKRPRLSSGRAH